MQSFKPDAIGQIFYLSEGRSGQVSSAIVIEDSRGLVLIEAKRYWGPAKAREVEAQLVKQLLVWAEYLRFEKFEARFSFPSPFSEDHKEGQRFRGSAEQKELWTLWQSFRLKRLVPSAPASLLEKAQKLAQTAHPRKNRPSKAV